MGQKSGSLRILLADDDLAFASCMSEQLNAEGFEVVTCTTTSKALEILSGASFDVLVTDLVFLPCDPAVRSGLDLIKHARHDDPTLPIVVLSATPSWCRHELFAANVPVVEKGIHVLDVLTGVIVDAARTRPPRVRRPNSAAGALLDRVRLGDVRRVFAEEARRLLEQKTLTVVVPGECSIG
jgi:CheY-like chemotaxis protein